MRISDWSSDVCSSDLLPERLRWAHLFIGRAGASTVAELACAGRPAIFVPYPHAMDDHQTWNVVDLVEAHGAQSISQGDFTPDELAKQIQRMALEPGAPETAAEDAASCGLPQETRDPADLVERTYVSTTERGEGGWER